MNSTWILYEVTKKKPKTSYSKKITVNYTAAHCKM